MKAKFIEFERGNPRDTLGVGARYEIKKIIEDLGLDWFVKTDQDFLEYGVRLLSDTNNHNYEHGERMIELGIMVGASLEETIDYAAALENRRYNFKYIIPGIVKYSKSSDNKDIVDKLKQEILDIFDNDVSRIISEKDPREKRRSIRDLMNIVNTFFEAIIGSPLYPTDYINKFKRREKQMYVLDFIQRSKNPKTRLEILSYSFQLSYGRGAKHTEGWGSTTFGSKGWIPKLTNKVDIPKSRAKGFVLNNVGEWTLEELKKKYKSTGRKVPDKYEIDDNFLDDVRAHLEKLSIR
jgi:hypothetical protein